MDQDEPRGEVVAAGATREKKRGEREPPKRAGFPSLHADHRALPHYGDFYDTVGRSAGVSTRGSRQLCAYSPYSQSAIAHSLRAMRPARDAPCLHHQRCGR